MFSTYCVRARSVCDSWRSCLVGVSIELWKATYQTEIGIGQHDFRNYVTDHPVRHVFRDACQHSSLCHQRHRSRRLAWSCVLLNAFVYLSNYLSIYLFNRQRPHIHLDLRISSFHLQNFTYFFADRCAFSFMLMPSSFASSPTEHFLGQRLFSTHLLSSSILASRSTSVRL